MSLHTQRNLLARTIAQLPTLAGGRYLYGARLRIVDIDYQKRKNLWNKSARIRYFCLLAYTYPHCEQPYRQALKREGCRKPMGISVFPFVTKSHMMRPTAGTNLKPCPLKPAASNISAP